LEAGRDMLEARAKELADELKLMKEQEKTEREQARAQVAQLKKTQDEVCDLSVGLISSLKLLVRAFSIR
jgi:F0F1-type ATP synthase assembly protein I